MIAVPVSSPIRRSVLVSPAHLEAHGMPTHPRDVLRHRTSRYRYPGTGRLGPWRFREGKRHLALDADAALVLTDNDHIRRAVLDGQGFAQRFRDTVPRHGPRSPGLG